MFEKRRFRRFAVAGTFCSVLMGMAIQAYGGTVVFDNYSGRNVMVTASTPNTFMGGGFVLAPGTTNISEIGYFPGNVSGMTFTGLQTTFYFWQTVNTTGTVDAGSPAFSNLLGTYTDTQTGTLPTGFYWPLDYVLPTPLSISDTTIGLTMNVRGTTDGITYNNVNLLTGVITYGAAPLSGSDVFNGYYQNTNSETSGNFISSLRSLGRTNQSVAFILYTQSAPEPGSLLLFLGGFAILGFFCIRRFQPAAENKKATP